MIPCYSGRSNREENSEHQSQCSTSSPIAYSSECTAPPHVKELITKNVKHHVPSLIAKRGELCVIFFCSIICLLSSLSKAQLNNYSTLHHSFRVGFVQWRRSKTQKFGSRWRRRRRFVLRLNFTHYIPEFQSRNSSSGYPDNVLIMISFIKRFPSPLPPKKNFNPVSYYLSALLFSLCIEYYIEPRNAKLLALYCEDVTIRVIKTGCLSLSLSREYSEINSHQCPHFC